MVQQARRCQGAKPGLAYNSVFLPLLKRFSEKEIKSDYDINLTPRETAPDMESKDDENEDNGKGQNVDGLAVKEGAEVKIYSKDSRSSTYTLTTDSAVATGPALELLRVVVAPTRLRAAVLSNGKKGKESSS